MYQSIAKVYDYIFPQNDKQLAFIEGIQVIQPDDMILEVGCATGNLTDLLHRKSKNIIGIDLDKDLLSYSQSKYPTYDNRYMNMLDIKDLEKQFDRVVCFGNTLVHLPNRDLVKDFFKSVHEQLNQTGLFIVQIINYDRIVNQNIHALATIDNDHINFKRDYVIHDNYVDFNTTLTIKKTQEVLEGSIPLLTLKKEELRTYLSEAGFTDIKFYGNLNAEALNENSVPLLFSCRKY